MNAGGNLLADIDTTTMMMKDKPAVKIHLGERHFRPYHLLCLVIVTIEMTSRILFLALYFIIKKKKIDPYRRLYHYLHGMIFRSTQ